MQYFSSENDFIGDFSPVKEGGVCKHTHARTHIHTPARLRSSQNAIVAQPTQADPLISTLSFLEAGCRVKLPGITTFFFLINKQTCWSCSSNHTHTHTHQKKANFVQGVYTSSWLSDYLNIKQPLYLKQETGTWCPRLTYLYWSLWGVKLSKIMASDIKTPQAVWIKSADIRNLKSICSTWNVDLYATGQYDNSIKTDRRTSQWLKQ